MPTRSYDLSTLEMLQLLDSNIEQRFSTVVCILESNTREMTGMYTDF